MPLRIGQHLTTPELANKTAGGDNYIRTKNKLVLGLAYNLKKNPFAPRTAGQEGFIVFGTGSRRKNSAYLFRESGAVAPAFIKRGTNDWEYIGDYIASNITDDPIIIRKYCGKRKPEAQAGVLFLKPATPSLLDPEVEVSGGGYATPETRKAIEDAAIKFVIETLEKRGYATRDRSRDNLGYDIFAVHDEAILMVEVKGTDAIQPRFFLTRKERLASVKELNWRLFVVCDARKSPSLYEYAKEQMEAVFGFDCLAWECVPKRQSANEIGGNP